MILRTPRAQGIGSARRRSARTPGPTRVVCFNRLLPTYVISRPTGNSATGRSLVSLAGRIIEIVAAFWAPASASSDLDLRPDFQSVRTAYETSCR